jgi:hypothetical protein
MDDVYQRSEAEPSTASKVVDGIQSTAERVSEAVETARRPGMPLDRLAARVRETPLAALAAAFLLGVIVTRRR